MTPTPPPMLRLRLSFLVLAVVLAAPACATSASSAPGAATSARITSIIRQDEMQGVSVSNMYDMVSRLRPQWLRSPAAAGSGSRTLVFLDGRQLGDLDQLRQIPPSSIREARYYSASEAQARLAVREASPVIALTSSR